MKKHTNSIIESIYFDVCRCSASNDSNRYSYYAPDVEFGYGFSKNTNISSPSDIEGRTYTDFLPPDSNETNVDFSYGHTWSENTGDYLIIYALSNRNDGNPPVGDFFVELTFNDEFVMFKNYRIFTWESNFIAVGYSFKDVTDVMSNIINVGGLNLTGMTLKIEWV